MADPIPNPLQMLRMAIPRPQFFLAILLGSVLVQYMISGLRYQADGSSALASSGGTSERVLPSSALLVTAHPDDEAMFFGPSVLALSAIGTTLYGLCLSTGNAAQLGKQRAAELYASYAVLGVPASRIHYLDDARLQDGMSTEWHADDVSQLISSHLRNLSQPVEAIITFDPQGISGHANHKAVYSGSRQLARSTGVPLYVLPSLEVWEKYNSIPFAVWDTVTFAGHPPAQQLLNQLSDPSYTPATELHILSSPQQYWTTVQAMLQHQTQLEWFRWLYLVFSRYMFSNRLLLWTPDREQQYWKSLDLTQQAQPADPFVE